MPSWSHRRTVKLVCTLMMGMLLLGMLLLGMVLLGMLLLEVLLPWLLPRMRMCMKVHVSQIGC